MDESLESLRPLTSLKSLENGRMLLCFPVWGFSRISRISKLSKISRKWTFLKRPPFPNPSQCLVIVFLVFRLLFSTYTKQNQHRIAKPLFKILLRLIAQDPVTWFARRAPTTLWHEIVTKIIPENLFFGVLSRFCGLKIFEKGRHFQGNIPEIRNFLQTNCS